MSKRIPRLIISQRREFWYGTKNQADANELSLYIKEKLEQAGYHVTIDNVCNIYEPTFTWHDFGVAAHQHTNCTHEEWLIITNLISQFLVELPASKG